MYRYNITVNCIYIIIIHYYNKVVNGNFEYFINIIILQNSR